MQSIGIFYFSGTGNTELVAELLKKSFERKEKSVQLFRIEEVLNNNIEINPDSFDVIGIGHPVLGFGASGIVDIFASKIPASKGKKTFVFKTASSHHYVNHGASDALIRKIRSKGYEVFHNSILAMPCNWYLKYEDSMIRQLYNAAVKRAEILTEEIISEKQQQLRINPLLGRIQKILYYLEENKGAKYFVKGLVATEACTLCRKCARGCPMKNISDSRGKISFGTNCIFCMRCVYSCPVNALRAKNMPGSVLNPYNGGINIHRVLNDPSIKGDFVSEKSKGYYKHFIKYFKEVGEI